MGRPGKLTSDEQLEVVKRIAWFWKEKDILKFVKDSFGKTLHQTAIGQYKNYSNWKIHIENIREKYLEEFTDVACANKRVRLEELQKHYDHFMEKGDRDRALGVLKDFRSEMEKKVGDLVINSNNFTQINNTRYSKLTDGELMDEISKTVKQLEIANKGVTDGLGNEGIISD